MDGALSHVLTWKPNYKFWVYLEKYELGVLDLVRIIYQKWIWLCCKESHDNVENITRCFRTVYNSFYIQPAWCCMCNKETFYFEVSRHREPYIYLYKCFGVFDSEEKLKKRLRPHLTFISAILKANGPPKLYCEKK